MSRRIRRGDDTGAYAILYGLLLLVVLGMAALVVDLGMLRQNRRETRLAADAAAVAGARELAAVSGAGNPRQACIEALSYLSTNLGVTFPSAPCDDLPVSTSPCPLIEDSALSSVAEFRALVTWPVLDSSTMMTDPDVKPAGAGVTSQAINPEVDGEDPCSRIGVSVEQSEGAAFAGAFGSDGASTVVTSVARIATRSGPGAAIAALNVLNQTACQAILTSGQGFIRVDAVDTRPGIIAVESSGLDTGSGCGNNKYVIDAATNATGGYVRADGPGPSGEGKGVILSWALNAAPTGNPTEAYNPIAIPTKLAPTPTRLSSRSGAAPVTDVYGCNSGCTTPYITNLRTAYGGTTIPVTGYAASPTPFDTLPFVPFTNCDIKSNDPPVIMPPANYYINCPGPLDVKGTLVFQGGNVVSRRGINISTGTGCFAVNVPVTTNACPTVTNGEVTTKPLTESILYLQSGDITRNGGNIFTANTFTYLALGKISFGGNAGTVLMTNPRLDTIPVGCDATCQNGRFYKVSLWAEATTTQVIGGQGSLFLRGVLFVPKSLFNYGGQAAQVQVGAQFWTDRIENSGQGGLAMAPDPSDAVETPLLNVVLIR